MKPIRVVALFFIFVFQGTAFSQNLVPNGNFENDFASWTAVQDVSISSSITNSGAKSLMVFDTTKTRYSYVYQALSLDYDQHEVSFWVYPASAEYFSAFELIANWQTPPVDFITRVSLRDSTMSFTAFDISETILNPLVQNSWNQVTIQVDKTTFKQDFFVNGTLLSSLTSSSWPTIEHLLVGDLSATGMFGILYFDEISITDMVTAISTPAEVPSEFALFQNYPNPFNPSTRISYQTVQPGRVVLKIYNALGQEMRTLVNKLQLPGNHSILWDGRDEGGWAVSSGVYLYRLTVNGSVKARKMLAIH